MSGSHTPQKVRKVIFPQEKKGELNRVNSQYSGTEKKCTEFKYGVLLCTFMSIQSSYRKFRNPRQ